jgi:hypothetical protein
VRPLDKAILAFVLTVLLALVAELVFGVGRLAGWWW